MSSAHAVWNYLVFIFSCILAKVSKSMDPRTCPIFWKYFWGLRIPQFKEIGVLYHKLLPLFNMGYADCMDLGAISGDRTIQLLESKRFTARDTHAFQLLDFTLELNDDTFEILLILHLDVIVHPIFTSFLGALNSAASMVLLGSSVRLTSLELLQGHAQALQKAKVCSAPSCHSL